MSMAAGVESEKENSKWWKSKRSETVVRESFYSSFDSFVSLHRFPLLAICTRNRLRNERTKFAQNGTKGNSQQAQILIPSIQRLNNHAHDCQGK